MRPLEKARNKTFKQIRSVYVKSLLFFYRQPMEAFTHDCKTKAIELAHKAKHQLDSGIHF